MSRYVCHFSVNLLSQHVRPTLKKLLAACGMETIHEVENYLMARETPGRVSFARLVTTEVLIDVTTTTQSAVKLSFVVKNQELPLNSNNHCRQVFDALRLAIARHADWHPFSGLQSNGLPSGKAIATAPAPKLDTSTSTVSTLRTMMN